jgi:hypothetical protein
MPGGRPAAGFRQCIGSKYKSNFGFGQIRFPTGKTGLAGCSFRIPVHPVKESRASSSDPKNGNNIPVTT